MTDNPPTQVELLAEVHRMVTTAAAMVNGDIPAVGSLAWWAADPSARIAGLLIAAEAYLVLDPDQYAREQLKQMTTALSGPPGYWTGVANNHITHTDLAARRAEAGPVHDNFDPEAVRRSWTSSNEEMALTCKKTESVPTVPTSTKIFITHPSRSDLSEGWDGWDATP